MLKAFGTLSSAFLKCWISPFNVTLPQSSSFSTLKCLTPLTFQQHLNLQPTSSQCASTRSLLSIENPYTNPTRNVTKFSLKTGKRKSVAAVLCRFYRLENGLWIRRKAGCHKHLHRKTSSQQYMLRQHVVCDKYQCLVLDKLITNHWKKKKYFIDDPFEPYKKRNNLDYVYPYRRSLVALAFSGSVGMTLLVLGCALPQYNNWYPFFVIIFYLLSPLPTLISRRYRDDMATGSACHELALFFTTGIIISAFGLPIILAEAPTAAPVILWGACGLVLAGNVVVFLTILGFFVAFDNDDVDYSMW